jgi:hypothetical protein
MIARRSGCRFTGCQLILPFQPLNKLSLTHLLIRLASRHPKISQVVTREIRLGIGVFIASFSVLLVRFLVPRPIGMADNGDGHRLLCQIGANESDRVMEKFVQFSYASSPSCFSNYVTSQRWLNKIARGLAHLLGSTAALDLIVLGVLCCGLAAFGIATIVVGLRLSRRSSIVATVALLLVVADSAFFGYFASVLSESSAFIGFLLLVGGLLLMARAGWWRYSGAAITVAGAVIAINAKSQTLVLIPLFVLALLFIRPESIRGLGRWIVPAVVLVAVGSATAFVQSEGDSGNAGYRQANVYHSIFDSIVDGEHDTNGDLAALGLPPEFGKYVGTNYWATNAAVSDPEFPKYENKITTENIVRFYATHPSRTLEILQKAGQDTLKARPDNLGSFGENSGQAPLAKEYRVAVLSGLTALIAPLGLFFLVPVWLLVGWAGFRAFGKRANRREVGVIVLMLTLFAIGQFGLSALGEGIEGVKHQLLTLFPTLLAAALAGLSFLPSRLSRQSKEPASTESMSTESASAEEDYALPATSTVS